MKRHPHQVLTVTQLLKELKGPYKTAYDKRIPKKLKSKITKKMQCGEITSLDQVKEILKPWVKEKLNCYPNQVLTVSQLQKELKGPYSTAYVIRIPSQERSEITRMMQSGEITTVDQVKEILTPCLKQSKSRKRRQISNDTAYEPPKQKRCVDNERSIPDQLVCNQKPLKKRVWLRSLFSNSPHQQAADKSECYETNPVLSKN